MAKEVLLSFHILDVIKILCKGLLQFLWQQYLNNLNTQNRDYPRAEIKFNHIWDGT